MFNPEEGILKNIDIDLMYQRCEAFLKKEALSIDDFRGVEGFSDEEIEKDKAYVQKMEEKFAQEMARSSEKERIHKLATLFEGILYTEAENSEWLGSTVYTIKTSRYDDIRNGIDIVAEFETEQNPQTSETPSSFSTHPESSFTRLGLAIDVTTAEELGKKLERIKEEIEKGQLPQVKYFFSENSNFRGRLSQVPRVVIGACRETVYELGGLWMEKKNKELGNHPIQFQILEEILLQLKTFEKYALQLKKQRLSEIYRKHRCLIEKIIQEKTSALEYEGERDEVFWAIKIYLKNFREPFPKKKDNIIIR